MPSKLFLFYGLNELQQAHWSGSAVHDTPTSGKMFDFS